MTKVKLPYEVYQAIENFRRGKVKDALLDIFYIKRRADEGNEDAKIIMNFFEESGRNRELYFEAIVKGYEAEFTPKQQVEEEFRKQWVKFWNAPCGSTTEAQAAGFRQGVRFVNDKLNLGLNLGD
jgi:hypothetical protein